MRILVLGAGGVGGYLGARLQEAGAEITFLVRQERKSLLMSRGLRLRSPFGDLHLQADFVTSEELKD
jgi:2-dehydropantoate 2-reductase